MPGASTYTVAWYEEDQEFGTPYKRESVADRTILYAESNT